ncbi:MAG TPA: hypothetical protein ENI52_03500, partial [Thermoplasmata archaeon]|nr:hypothetical protein [Thermoplasmata archaeon]
MLAKTGIDRIDELLKGGIPVKSNVLIYATPFIGKEIILKRFALSGLAEGDRVIFVLTDKSFRDLSEEMRKLDESYTKYEKNGLVNFIDVYSPSVELKEKSKWVTFIDSPINRERIASSVIQTMREKEGNYRVI